MHEGYSALGRLPMENGPQSIGGNGHGTGGAELWCGCHIPGIRDFSRVPLID